MRQEIKAPYGRLLYFILVQGGRKTVCLPGGRPVGYCKDGNTYLPGGRLLCRGEVPSMLVERHG